MPSPGIQAICDVLLKRSLELSGAPLGNVQLAARRTDLLTIVSQHGFGEDFLKVFETVHPLGAPVCARAVQRLSTVIVEDVMADAPFKPYREIAERAGFRTVSSTPMISSSGLVLGVVSQHYPSRHKPSKATVAEMGALARAAADALFRVYLDADIRHVWESRRLTEQLIATSRQKVQAARKLLDGGVAAISAPQSKLPFQDSAPE